MNIIPAIDIIDGKCVRLRQGNYSAQTTYSAQPLDVAKQFQDNGLQYLHLVDLDGARIGSPKNMHILKKIAANTNLSIDYSGGIRCATDIQKAFDNGANKVTIGSIAVKDSDTVKNWKQLYGEEKIVLGADCRNKQIVINGWEEKTTIDIIMFIKNYVQAGFNLFMCTDITHDGMLAGPPVALYRKILAATNIQLIASGGIRSIADIQQLKEIGCCGAIIGKAIYEGQIQLSELRNYVEEKNNTMS